MIVVTLIAISDAIACIFRAKFHPPIMHIHGAYYKLFMHFTDSLQFYTVKFGICGAIIREVYTAATFAYDANLQYS
jgi:hypothetical protein